MKNNIKFLIGLVIVILSIISEGFFMFNFNRTPYVLGVFIGIALMPMGAIIMITSEEKPKNYKLEHKEKP